jgi:hypothetical protein
MTFYSLFNFNARLPCEIRESVAGRKYVDPTFDSDSSVIDISKYLFFVLCILLIISGIEINPGPSLASESSAQVLPKSAHHYSEEYKTFHIGISYY